jgi:hypothetical protein
MRASERMEGAGAGDGDGWLDLGAGWAWNEGVDRAGEE